MVNVADTFPVLGYSSEEERPGPFYFGIVLNPDGEEGDLGPLPNELLI